MRNKRGEGYIPTCVMIIILTMLLSIFVTFVSAVNIVKQTKRNSRVVLDSYVMEESIAIYNSIKNGNDETMTLDSDSYVDSLCDFCTFVKTSNKLYNYNSDGDMQFYLTKPTVGYMRENELKIYASYTVYIPIYFAGIRVDTAAIPVTVKSNFTEKF